ncbi:MAG: methyltransferase domain-containing protein [Rhodovibrionaceae bacterium]
MEREAYTAANKAAWNDSAALHRAGAAWERLREGFAQPGFSCLDAVETALFAEVGIAGKDVAQLCCNNAREILSVKNLGAARCVGFDQSAAFLAQGGELAVLAGQELELVEGDVYAIPAAYDGSFDIVLITIGVFGWMPDLGAFFAIVARLLKPGGQLLVHEEHPIMNVFEPAAERPFEPASSYFRKAPFAENHAIVYYGEEAPEVETHYWFVHPLSAVIMVALGAGLTLESFREYPNNISSAEFDLYETRAGVELPMSYTLVARKA